MNSDLTNAERSRRWRARRAGELPPAKRLICSACGKGRSGRYGEICRRCWERVTPEGRAAKAERVAKARAKGQDMTDCKQASSNHVNRNATRYSKSTAGEALRYSPQPVMTTTLPELPKTLLDMGPWGACVYATPEAATAMAAELGWDTAELDRVHLNESGDAYLYHETQDGRTHTQVIRVKPGAAEGEFVAIND